MFAHCSPNKSNTLAEKCTEQEHHNQCKCYLIFRYREIHRHLFSHTKRLATGLLVSTSVPAASEGTLRACGLQFIEFCIHFLWWAPFFDHMSKRVAMALLPMFVNLQHSKRYKFGREGKLKGVIPFLWRVVANLAVLACTWTPLRFGNPCIFGFETPRAIPATPLVKTHFSRKFKMFYTHPTPWSRKLRNCQPVVTLCQHVCICVWICFESGGKAVNSGWVGWFDETLWFGMSNID